MLIVVLNPEVLMIHYSVCLTYAGAHVYERGGILIMEVLCAKSVLWVYEGKHARDCAFESRGASFTSKPERDRRKHPKKTTTRGQRNQGGDLEEDPRARPCDTSPPAEAVSFESSPLR